MCRGDEASCQTRQHRLQIPPCVVICGVALSTRHFLDTIFAGTQVFDMHTAAVVAGWWRSTVVDRQSLTGELSLSRARPAADG